MQSYTHTLSLSLALLSSCPPLPQPHSFRSLDSVTPPLPGNTAAASLHTQSYVMRPFLVYLHIPFFNQCWSKWSINLWYQIWLICSCYRLLIWFMYESIIPELVDSNIPVLVETSHAISNWTSFSRNDLSNFT